MFHENIKTPSGKDMNKDKTWMFFIIENDMMPLGEGKLQHNKAKYFSI